MRQLLEKLSSKKFTLILAGVILFIVIFMLGLMTGIKITPPKIIKKIDTVYVQSPPKILEKVTTITLIDVIEIEKTVVIEKEVEILVEQKPSKSKKRKLNRHQFSVMMGYGPSGLNVKSTDTSIKFVQQFAPLVGGGYKYLITNHFGVGAWALNNRSYGTSLSWEF